MSEQIGQALIYALILILPLSALVARRVPIGATLKMALAWAAIFLVGLVIVGQRERIARVWTGLVGSEQMVSGSTVRITMAEDGHFWAQVRINGQPRRMLVDSGATTTALSAATASAAGLDIDENPFPVTLNTANGPVEARTATVDRFELGAIVAHGLPVVVSGAFGDTDVVGMNFLSRLRSWRVEGRTLILEPERVS